MRDLVYALGVVRTLMLWRLLSPPVGRRVRTPAGEPIHPRKHYIPAVRNPIAPGLGAHRLDRRWWSRQHGEDE